MISMAMGSLFNVDETSKIASMESKAVGLKILTTKTPHLNHSKPIFQRIEIPSSSTCFIKSCFLCHKHISFNKDVYMYRGDQSFCSEECRDRQIYIDDVQQLEISTKKMIKRYRQSHSMASPVFCL
ncbi:hypothetical protein L2E82_27791 [Cichorium intybus]|uniref:Uncharacterized protein n=1 Tax=Cichorium intybus TaxID=13427 RepID=A0ACB9CU05_CICIN|nr:hypothetical protein L2E82_27791 [Cichorium intybus]